MAKSKKPPHNPPIEEFIQYFKPLTELHFLLDNSMVLHMAATFAYYDPKVFNTIFEEDAPDDAREQLESVLPKFSTLVSMALHRIDKVLPWLEAHPKWKSLDEWKTCADQLKEVRSSIEQIAAQVKVAEDRHSDLSEGIRLAIKDTAFCEILSATKVILGIFKSLEPQAEKALKKVPPDRRLKVKDKLTLSQCPRPKINPDIPNFVGIHWRVALNTGSHRKKKPENVVENDDC